MLVCGGIGDTAVRGVVDGIVEASLMDMVSTAPIQVEHAI